MGFDKNVGRGPTLVATVQRHLVIHRALNKCVWVDVGFIWVGFTPQPPHQLGGPPKRSLHRGVALTRCHFQYEHAFRAILNGNVLG